MHKFGGSCLKTQSDIYRISEIVNDSKHSPIVIVSAVFGVTNRLLDAIGGCESPESFINEMKQIHQEIAGPSSRVVQSEKFTKLLTRLQYDLELLQSNFDVNIQNRILAFGEKATTLVVADHLKQTLTDAKPLWSEEIGISIIGENRNRRIDVEKTKSNLLRNLDNSVVPVITGWYGIDKAGVITVLDRGGSDVTASAVGNMLQADKVVLWKDVGGVLTLSPCLGLHGKKIQYLGYSEAREIARLGTTVLHPLCIDPVCEAGIPLELRLINDETQGTIVGPDLHLEEPQTKAIVCTHPVRNVSLSSTKHRHASSITRQVLDVLNKHGAEVWFLNALSAKIQIVLSEECHREPLRELSELGFDIKVGDSSALVSLVGNQIENWSSELEQFLNDKKNWQEKYKFIGGEDTSIHFLTDESTLDEIIKNLSERLGLIETKIDH